VEAALYSLTCRRIYETIKKRKSIVLTRIRNRVTPDERLAFLGFLEKDNADLITCPVDKKLHERDWRSEGKPYIGSIYECEMTCTKRQGCVDLGPAPEDGEKFALVVTRPVLDLVLRHASLGPTFGIATTDLKWGRIYKVKSDTVATVTFEIEARVIGHLSPSDHLLVRTCYVMVSISTKFSYGAPP
jgi:hypothetical protein